RMVRNLSIDVLRSRPIIEEDLSLLGNLAIGEDNGNAAFQIEMKDAVEWVKKFLGLLPEKQKQIMMMRDMEEYSLEEIENATGLSAVHVRVLLSRARKKIREQINHIMSNEKR
ncbi:MAG: sigma-70 family RNA polymerase sigma factor, partial [Bacteroidaceae bacterium]|nr:sigma-70 family RNA polymerase sigma factor [Bacteroidaceae bacterium]